MSRLFLRGSLGLLLLASAGWPVHGVPQQGYVGADVCAKCHGEVQHDWRASSHGGMMQRATKESVKGEFAQGKVVLRGATYLLGIRDNQYYITEPDLSGKPLEHKVEYTLGERRFQHYLAKLEDGRILVLPPTWDIARKQWTLDLEIGNPEEAAGDPIQVWNKNCYSCHVSQGQKNFDLEKLRYQTTWQDLGINCESCHGPGREHIARATRVQTMDAATRVHIKEAIVNPARLNAASSTTICAQCHSLRDIYADSFKAGADYYEYFMPVMEYRLPTSTDSAYWPDGRPRQLANEAFGLWQSQCFLKGGATCATCHTRPHASDVAPDARLRPGNNALCTGCHTKIATNLSAHTHHVAKSTGSFCIECHMPATVVSLNTRMRDHSMSVPTPENTIRHDIPNACNVCHHDKDAEWTLQRINAWYGEKTGQRFVTRADAFTRARERDAAAVPELLSLLADSSGGPLIRANAAGYLGSFSNDPSAYQQLLHAFSDPEPLVRATAATTIRPSAAQREELATKLVTLLRDPIRTVRVSAAIAMVAMGVRPFPGEDGERFERAKEQYHARAELDSDDAQQQLAAGRFSFLSGDFGGAVNAFRATLKLDPTIPAQYYLGRSLAEENDFTSAREVLNAIPRDDKQYDAAQRLLAGIAAKEPNPQQTQAEDPGSNGGAARGQAKFLAGQVLYQSEAYGAAVKDIEEALQLAPRAEWATKAEIYRAICLEKLGRVNEAEDVMRKLSEQPEGRTDVDLQVAFVELLCETGRAEEGLKRVDGVIAGEPKAPKAYFWRAKVLLQLHRPDEAASAAEEAVRLLPQFPEAHNLLLRIYQMKGRSKEAAEQAEWLRNYHRQKDSH